MTRCPLVVTADDYGLTDGTCDAILHAHEHGIVTATSVLATAPAARRRLGSLVDAGGLSAGVHLALVGEDPPLLAAGEIPTLVDRRGRLRASWRQLLPLLAAGRIDPADVRRECQAQIDAVVAGGVRPRHLDSHQHLHLWPSVGQVVVALAGELGGVAVRVPRPSRSGPRALGIATLADRLAAAVAAAGLPATERFAGLDEAGGWTVASLRAALEDLAQGSGSVEVNLHPGPAQDPDRGRYRWRYRWGDELAAAVDPQVRDAVDRLGFELVGR